MQIDKLHPDWFYRQSHVVEEPWEFAELRNFQAGVTWFANGVVSPRSARFQELLASGLILPPGTEVTWAEDNVGKNDGSLPEAGDIVITPSTKSTNMLFLEAKKVVSREKGIVTGIVQQTRVEWA